MSESAATANGHPVPSARGETVVVVVHERALRHAAVRVLRQAGYTVLAASTGGRGLEMMGSLRHPPACIILDSAVRGPSASVVLAQLPTFAAAGAAPVLLVAPDGEFVAGEPRIVRTLRKPVDERMLPLLVAVTSVSRAGTAHMGPSWSLSPWTTNKRGPADDAKSRLVDDVVIRGQGWHPAPAALTEALLLSHKANVSLADLVAAVKDDVYLTAGVLRLANTPLHVRRRRVHTVAEAIVTLGLRELRLYLLTNWVACSLCRPLEAYSPGGTTLLDHALWTGVLARLIVCHLGLATAAPDAYLGGLLHDAGKVSLNALWLERRGRRRTQTLLPSGGWPGVAAERALFGLDHAEVGSRLAEAWGVEEGAATLIAQHHTVADDRQVDPVLLAVCLANQLAPPRRAPADSSLLAALGLEDDIGRLLAQTNATVRDVGAFLIRPGVNT